MKGHSRTITIWLKEAGSRLKQAGIITSRLDALVLLEDVFGKERSWLLANPETELTDSQLSRLDGFIDRRLCHEPLAYIRNKSEFYGRDFFVDKRVLEPRPESEAIIDMLKELAGMSQPIIIDVGTGSGALAITAKIELPNAEVVATDIDNKCLAVARQNAQNHNVNILFFQGSLLQALPSQLLSSKNLILLCNLPYVPDKFQLNQAALNEPRLAIFGGPDGLEVYRKLFKQLTDLKIVPEYVLTESMPPQHKHLTDIAQADGFRLLKTDDFIQLFVTV